MGLINDRGSSAAKSPFAVDICTTLWRFAAVNLATLVLILAGGILPGMGPAFAACLWAMSRSKEEPAGVLVSGMRREWQAEFVRSNLALAPATALLIGVVLWIPNSGGLRLALLLVSSVVLSAYLLAIVYVISQVHCSIGTTLSNAARLMIVTPGRLLGSLASVPPLLLITAWQPWFGFYGVFSVTAWVTVVMLYGLCDSVRSPLADQERQSERIA